MGTSFSINGDKNEKYIKTYKGMIFIDEINNSKLIFKSFLISIKTVPNFIKLIKEVFIIQNDINNNKNRENITKKAFQNYKPEKHIKIYNSFEECEYIINQNLTSEHCFIIVNEYFFKYLDINIKDKTKKQVMINIDKNKSLYSVTFPTSNKSLNFIELNPGVYQFKQGQTENNESSLVSNENNSLLKKIKSKYIIYEITSFIKDNSLLLKLIKYSKSIQEKLNINILNYKESFYSKRINYDYLLSDFNPEKKHNFSRHYENEFKKDKIDNNAIAKFITNYFNNYHSNIKNKELALYEYSKDIDFTCPFFNELSNTEFFNKIFDILISEEKLEDKNNNLKNIYTSTFEYLNKNNINYPSITFYIRNNQDVNILNEFNINFNQIKKLKLLEGKYYSRYSKFDFIGVINSYNIPENLVYFEYNLSKNERKDPAKYEIINNLKSLKYLILYNCDFSSKFELKLNNLEHLILKRCDNIIFSKCNLSQLKYLKLKCNSFELTKKKVDSLLLCPELNKLILIYNKNYKFDIRYCKNLKYFKGCLNHFLLLEETSLLEEIIMEDGIDESDLKEIKKEIERKKSGNYYSVKKIKLYRFNLNMDDFLNIFPNLSELIINIDCEPTCSCGALPFIREKKIILTENPNSKIKNIKIVLIAKGPDTIKIQCLPYNKIESLDLCTDFINEDSFPLFKSEFNVIFNSLKVFRFTLKYPPNPSESPLAAIKYLFRNIDKMSNLTEFHFSFINREKSGKNTPNNELIKEIIRKIASLRSIKKYF